MKKVQYSVIITFISLILILCVLSLFPDADGFSEFENRKLSSRPLLSLNSIFSGEFEENHEEYLLDNFLLRDLSMQGYQSYTSMLFLDAFSQSVSVLMSVDVDNFVEAPGQDSTQVHDEQLLVDGHESKSAQQSTTEYQSTAGQQSTTGQGDKVFQQNTEGKQGAAGGQSQEGQRGNAMQYAGNQQSAEGLESIADNQSAQVQQPGMEYSEASKYGDQKLNNSLIIHGDRVMMPTGAYRLKSFGKLLADTAELLPDISLYSITGPTSAAFYASEKYASGTYDQSKAESIIEANAKDVRVVKAYDRLKEHKDENIYFRSDVHWTALGAYYAYTAFCESAGIQAASLGEDFTMDTYEPFLGGLYSQIYKLPQAARLKSNPEQLDYYIPKTGHQMTLYKMGNLNAPYSVEGIINTNFKSLGAYKYSCFAWGDQRIEKIATDSPTGRRALVVKDSYGSAFVPFLVPNYSSIYVIDPKGFNQEGCLAFDAKTLIKDEEIEDVIFCFSIYGSGRNIIQNTLYSLLLE